MNPNDLFLRQNAAAAASSPAAAASQAPDSAAAPGGAAAAAAAPTVTAEQLQEQFHLEQLSYKRQRAHRERDANDNQLAQLLDAMDDYKPIARPPLAYSLNRSC